MLNYEDLINELENAWIAAGLHEHDFIESVVPASHDRTCKIELFPEHEEPMSYENTPPWAELAITWGADHQLRSEGRAVPISNLDLSWTYTVNVRRLQERSDTELVRMFQRAVHAAFVRYYPHEAEEMDPVAVEVRRIYQSDGQRISMDFLQLVSNNITDLAEQFDERDPVALRQILRVELQLVSTILSNLNEIFCSPGGRGGYHTVDAA